MQGGDFGDETCTDCVPGSAPGQRAETPVLAKRSNLPWPELVRPSGPFPAACQHGWPLERSGDHSQQAVFMQPGVCLGKEGFTGEDASLLCQLPLVPAALRGLLHLLV